MIRGFRAVILGAPGSGKGTISSRIVRKFDMKHISSGDLLNRHILEKTPVGLESKKYVEKGELVPDRTVTEVVLQLLETSENNSWLLDGFPRTKMQAEILSKTAPVHTAINLIVPFDVIVKRIEGRWVHPGSGRVYNVDFNAPKVAGRDDVTGEPLVQRNDDTPEAVQHRLDVYSNTMGPVLQHFRDEGILEEFMGKSSDEIWPLVYRYLRLHANPISQDIRI